MALQYSIITGNEHETLIDLQSVKSIVTNLNTITFDSNIMKSIHICNTHNSEAVVVALYIVSTDDIKYYTLKNTTIAHGARLFLEKKEISFNNKIYKMVIKLNNSDSIVSVIIR